MHRALSTMTTILTTRRRRFRLDLEPCDGEGDQGGKRFDNNRSHQGVARNSASAAAISIRSGVRVKSMLIILDLMMARERVEGIRLTRIGRYPR